MNDPRLRVERYITDWHAAWTRAVAQMGDDVDFEVWGAMIGEVDAAHFVHGRGSGSEGSFGTPPDHSPTEEQVTGVDPHGARATVETTLTGPLTRYREYDLVASGGEWRIERIVEHLRPADAPMVTAEERAAAFAAVTEDRVFDPLPAGWAPDGDRLFTGGREVTHGEEVSTTVVREVGRLDLRSGVIAVRDLGYDVYEYPVLRHRLPVGQHPVEIVEAFGRVAAVRVRFGGGNVASWHPAADTAGGDAVGVDAGNVAILDAESFAAASARRRERVFGAAVEGRLVAKMLGMSRADDGVLVASGWGDGVYPLWLGVDAAGAPAQLVVDFQILAEVVDGVYRH